MRDRKRGEADNTRDRDREEILPREIGETINMREREDRTSTC